MTLDTAVPATAPAMGHALRWDPFPPGTVGAANGARRWTCATCSAELWSVGTLGVVVGTATEQTCTEVRDDLMGSGL